MIIAFDISSTTIGYVVYDDAVIEHGNHVLRHADINHRCRLARAFVFGLVQLYPCLDACAIEAPGGQFKGSIIPQCFVSGAVRSYLAERNIVICDVAAQHAKQALTKRGNASKLQMQEAALAYGVTGEHAADALGVALAAIGRIEQVAA